VLQALQFALFVLLVIGSAGAVYVVVRRRPCDVRAAAGLLFFCACTISIASVISGSSMHRVRDHLQSKLIGFAPTYADEFRRRGATSIDFDTAPDDPTYLELIETQKQWLALNPAIADIYTFRVVDGICRLLVDSETDYDGDGLYTGEREARTPIGEAFGEAGEFEHRAMAGERIFADEIVQDRWGAWVSAYAPIFNDDGTVHSILGVDLSADDWVRRIADAQRISLLSILLMHAVVSCALTMVCIWSRALERARCLARGIEESKRSVEAASNAKSEFLANMSHEIRTPMNAILGFTDVLLERVNDETVRHDLEVIHRNAHQLLDLVNDILDLSRIESGRHPAQILRFDLHEVLSGVADLLRQRASDHGLDLRIDWPQDGPDWVMSDPDRIRQVLVNLVGNAIKFTHDGSVVIRAQFEQMLHDDKVRSRAIVLSVSDTGIGMTPDELQRIWKPFEQADSSITRRYGGTGLGLTICRRIVQGLGGRIDVTSTPGVGSTFTMRIPDYAAGCSAARDSGPASATKQELQEHAADVGNHEKNSIRGMRVLYAEDGRDNQQLVTYHLERAGASVHLVSNGQEAMDALTHEPDRFDLVLMDMQMPVMDGYAATARLRTLGCELPIVAVTAHAMSGDRERCMSIGCSDYIAKPVSRDALIACCARWKSADSRHGRPAA